MDEEKIRDLQDELSELQEDRKEWENTWHDITDYVLPRKGKYLENRDANKANKGDQRNTKIMDSTATRALRVLAAGMQGGLTSPARPWFRMAMEDDDLNKITAVKSWLSGAEKKMYSVFSKSNFYTSIHNVYGELGGFGTSAVLILDDMEKNVRFRPMTAGEYYLATNDKSQVDTLYRLYHQTARQLVMRFGESKVSQQVKNANDSKKRHEWFPVVHCVKPRENYDLNKSTSISLPWLSVYYEYKKPGEGLSESGFHEFPAACPRWDVTSVETYGRSPAMDVLPDVKMLMEMRKDYLKQTHKVADPPLKLPQGLKGQEISLAPGGFNYFDPTSLKDVDALYKVSPQLEPLANSIMDLRMQIREGLFNDLFLMLIDAKAGMTATEVVERHEEKLLMLGPVIERQINELLDPIINRVFMMLLRQGEIDPPPEEIQGENFKVEYISLLAQAQKLVGTQAINATANFVYASARSQPEAIDLFNVDGAIREYAELTGVSPNIINDDDKVAAIRSRRDQLQAQQRQLEAAQSVAATAKTASETKLDENSALAELESIFRGGAL